MSIKIRNIIFLSCFILVIGVPIIDWQIGISAKLFPSVENRVLTKASSIDITKPEKFVKSFDNYYKDNFGLRNPLYIIYSKIKFHLFNISPLNDKVIVGKDGWLFLGNRFGKVIDETLGIDTLNDQELKRITNNINKNNFWLEQKGIKYYVAIAPNKHSIYKEHLPDYLNIKPNNTKLEQLKKHLKREIDFEIIDLSEKINKYKNVKRLYHKTGTHWNDYGAFLAYQDLIGKLKKDFSSIKIRNITSYKIDTHFNHQEDLSKLMEINIKEESILLSAKFESNCQLAEKSLNVPNNFKRKPKDYEIRYRKSEENKKLKVLIFRDSFCTSMIQFIKESFYETVFIWITPFDRSVIELEKPDIVITEVVERNIDFLMKRNY